MRRFHFSSFSAYLIRAFSAFCKKSLPNNGVATLCDGCRPALRLPADTNGWKSKYYYLTLVIDYYRDDEWPSFPGLQESIRKTGCDFCQLLKTTLTSKEVKSDVGSLAVNSVRLGFKWSAHRGAVPDGKILEIDLWNSSDLHVTVSLPVSSKSEEVAKLYDLPSPIEPSVLAEGPVKLIRRYLDCCSHHSHHNNDTPKFTPTRLVDVSSKRTRIVELNTPSNEPPPDRRYLALSYCWGGRTQLLLTHDTEEALKNGFSTDILSATQKDTIELAKALSIPYVWIDALCIRQLDHNDWESQAKVMGNIYSGAYLTVCAASSSSCEEGYLQRDFVTPIEVPTDPVSDPSGSAGTYFFQPIRWSCDSGRVHNCNAPSSLLNSKWNTRAWTFQERMMSTRLLFFTTSGLHFNCGRFIGSEYNTPQGPLLDNVPISSVRDTFELEQLLRTGDKSAVYDAWMEKVVDKYGDREMTKQTDAFPSLSGLAHTFASLLQDDYVAGIWKQDLARGLSWKSLRPAHNSLEALLSSYNSPDLYIGPSWSWVGHGEVQHCRVTAGLVNVCQELSAECVSKGADECGELESASLRVRTQVYPLKSGTWGFSCDGTRVEYRYPGSHDGIDIVFDFKNGHQSDLENCVLIYIGTFFTRMTRLVSAIRAHYGLVAHLADDGVRFIRIGRFEVGEYLEIAIGSEDLGKCEIRDIEII